jgi:hypothetical protein
MRSRLWIALALLTTLLVSMGGCSKKDLGVEPRLLMKGLGGAAKPDTTPKPTPPPDTTYIPAEFVIADSAEAGGTGVSHWLLRTKKPFTTTWTLTADPSWPGYPIQGTVRLTPNKAIPLSIPFSAPSFALNGIHPLTLVVTTPSGSYTAYGYFLSFGNDSVPPPPPQPAVVFFGADSVLAGTSGNTSWELTNESGHSFTMDWALSARSAWPGFPIQGSVALAPNESRLITVSVPVPDSAAAGPRGLDMQVTRPDGLPPGSSTGFIFVFH